MWWILGGISVSLLCLAALLYADYYESRVLSEAERQMVDDEEDLDLPPGW